MAKISTYASVAPALGDMLIGTDVNDMNSTKNFSISDIFTLANSTLQTIYVPYTGANANVDLGTYSIESSSFIVGGGLSTQFLKADGTLDSTIYLSSSTAGAVYVPYTGATQDVDLGLNNLTADILTTTDRVQTSLIIPQTGAGDKIDIGLKVVPYITVDTLTQRVELNKPLYVDSSTGTAGQVLISQGSSAEPTWATPPFIVPNYGSFYDVTTQTTLGATQELMQFGTTDFSSGVTITNDGLGDPTRITFSEAGTYNIQFSAQIERTGGSADTIYIYLIKNGVAVPNSSTAITIGNNNRFVIAAWNFFVDIPSIPYNCQIGWYSTGSNVNLHYDASPVAGIPAIPSVILTVNRIA